MFETPRQIRTAVVGDGNYTVAPAPLAQIDFGTIWSALWRGRTTIILATLAALAFAVVYIALAPREYTAVTQILIDPSDLRAVGSDTQPAQANDVALLQVESQVSVLTSDAVLRRVVASESLDRNPEFVRGPSLFGVLLGRNDLPGGRSLAALNELKRRVKVKRDERIYVIEVDVSSRDPNKATKIQNTMTGAASQAGRVKAEPFPPPAAVR
jgi:uncharacterized protein involved in exopolysaccharide biosynthesis